MVTPHRPAALAGRGGGAAEIEELIHREPVVEVRQHIAASPGTVFSYLTDPRKFVAWMGVGAQLDPRPGGRFRIDVDGEHFASGEYRHVDPPRRLVMTWGWETDPDVPPGSTEVEITLADEGSGTLLLLRHRQLPNEAQRSSHTGGWQLFTGNLKRAVEGSRPAA